MRHTNGGLIWLAAAAVLALCGVAPAGATATPIIVSVLMGAAIIVRNLFPRRMRVSRILIAPSVLAALTVFSIGGSIATGTSPLLVLVWVAAGCALGVPFGLLRGRHTRVRTTDHPNVLIVEPAIVPLLIWAAAFAVRFSIRAFMPHAGSLALAASDGFLAFAVVSLFVVRVVIAAKFKAMTTG